MEEKLDAVRLRMQPAIDSGEYVVPTVDQVREMLHAHFENSRIRNEENEKQSATRRWGRESPAFRRKSY